VLLSDKVKNYFSNKMKTRNVFFLFILSRYAQINTCLLYVIFNNILYYLYETCEISGSHGGEYEV
jgi:hypothetical protein